MGKGFPSFIHSWNLLEGDFLSSYLTYSFPSPFSLDIACSRHTHTDIEVMQASYFVSLSPFPKSFFMLWMVTDYIYSVGNENIAVIPTENFTSLKN